MYPDQRQLALKNKSVYISCIVPVYNEASNVSAFFAALSEQLQKLTDQYEIIVVNDGSKDSTNEKIIALPPEYRIKLISFSRNFGKEIALTAGLDHAQGQVSILIDADFQHPLEVLPEFLRQWSLGYEMVYGVRTNRDNESKVKRNFTHLFYWLMSKITKLDIPNNAGDFRLLDQKVVKAIKSFNERSRFMKGLYAWVGFKKIAVPFDVQQRTAGRSSWGFKRLAELAVTGITTFSDIPLRVWGFVGFIVSVISFIYAMYIVTVTLMFGADLPGFPSIMVAVMFFGGIQLLSIGIMGEYIARIFTEVKQRPKYIIEYMHGFEE